MKLLDVDLSIVLTITGLLLAVLTYLISLATQAQKRAVMLEARIITIENILQTQLKPIWDMIMARLPDLIISPHTPTLDTLLETAKNGLHEMPVEHVLEMAKLLEEQYDIATVENDDNRRLYISLFLVRIMGRLS